MCIIVAHLCFDQKQILDIKAASLCGILNNISECHDQEPSCSQRGCLIISGCDLGFVGHIFCYLASQGPHLLFARPFQHPCHLFLSVSVGIHLTCLQRLLLKAVSIPATPRSLRPRFLQGPKQTFGLSGCFCLNSVWYALSFHRFSSTRTKLNFTLMQIVFSPRI